MKNAAPRAIAITKAIDDVMSHDRGRLLAGLIARLGDFQRAEDALQDALITALGQWTQSGVPKAPASWLMRVALNKGIDGLRSAQRETRKGRDYSLISQPDGGPDGIAPTPADAEDIPDERLRLIFACCHPALDEKSRVALTLRSVCGLTTREIAGAFLDNEPTMGQRITRAKSKIKAKGLGFSVPDQDLWDMRLDTVLSTIYLIYTTGYVTDDTGPRDLCAEALFLARLLVQLRPDNPEIEGALALMLLTQARQPARIGPDGASLPVALQRRDLWDQTPIAQARDLMARAIARKQPGPFQIKAAIADCHMEDPAPDWPQMSLLYQSLWHHEPTPVVALNWAVVLAELGHVQTAFDRVQSLRGTLGDFQPWFATKADLLVRLGRPDEAAIAYRDAIAMAPNAANRRFLESQLARLDQTDRPGDP